MSHQNQLKHYIFVYGNDGDAQLKAFGVSDGETPHQALESLREHHNDVGNRDALVGWDNAETHKYFVYSETGYCDEEGYNL